MRGRKRADVGDEGAEGGDDAPASSRRRMLAANAREGRAEEDVLQVRTRRARTRERGTRGREGR